MKKEKKKIVEGIVEIIEKREKGKREGSEKNEWGIVGEVRDDVVYVKGLMKERMLEMVEFEGILGKGIINYLDKKKKAGITVLGSANEIKVGSRAKILNKKLKINTKYWRVDLLEGLVELKEANEVLIEKIALKVICSLTENIKEVILLFKLGKIVFGNGASRAIGGIIENGGKIPRAKLSKNKVIKGGTKDNINEIFETNKKQWPEVENLLNKNKKTIVNHAKKTLDHASEANYSEVSEDKVLVAFATYGTTGVKREKTVINAVENVITKLTKKFIPVENNLFRSEKFSMFLTEKNNLIYMEKLASQPNKIKGPKELEGGEANFCTETEQINILGTDQYETFDNYKAMIIYQDNLLKNLNENKHENKLD